MITFCNWSWSYICRCICICRTCIRSIIIICSRTIRCSFIFRRSL